MIRKFKDYLVYPKKISHFYARMLIKKLFQIHQK